ncbi:outer membrane protein [Bartonella doshiae]|uniref:Opacity protein and related surface antigens n=2 Tax=Bartonella doshiae TaxID=33044 RepID=A0A380ZHD0_BARDO|nr:outer membrane protein [Bartonella doshiae]EJF80050.1 hypothetical protein MCS_01245 [Bartonella doshiae NCTC 12862 = ATCC 700133]MBB6158905.1 outer membrane immunogenic protein [Bartonella doshiae]SUV45585.1 Opacity protein and related surface antigens [Bartonella doshiae]
MNTKRLIKISVFTLMTTSAVQAADTVAFQEQKMRIAPVAAPIIIAPSFSWKGFYIGGQAGVFSSENTLTYSEETNKRKWKWVDKDLSPKPSGPVFGLYAGYNIDLADKFVLGVETDIVRSERRATQTGDAEPITSYARVHSLKAVFNAAEIPIEQPKALNQTAPNIGDLVTSSVTLEEKWAGATRVRIGFSCDRIMPYIAGGISYAQIQYIMSLSAKDQNDESIIAEGELVNETEKMVGYTFGGGVDFAVTDNITLRAEYRYADFGKKKFAEDDLEISSRTNNFRVGVAYKF